MTEVRTEGTAASGDPHHNSPFARWGRRVARHPWYVIAFWVAALAISLPLLPHLGDATTPSALSLPSSDPSSQETLEIDRVFPNASAPSDVLVVLEGASITSASGRNATLGVTRAIENDPAIEGLRQVDTLYTSYAAYVDGEATVALAVLQGGVEGNLSVLSAVNGTAELTWGVVSTFLGAWENAETTDPSGTPPVEWNEQAESASESLLASNPLALQNLSLFYHGDPGAGNGFNGTADCDAAPASVVACADATERSVVGALSPPAPLSAVLAGLGVENFSSWSAVQNVTAGLLAPASGLSGPLLLEVWRPFASLAETPKGLSAWVNSTVGNGTATTYSPTIPAGIWQEFVSPADNLTVLVVTLNYSDDGPQDAASVAELGRIVPLALSASDPGGGVDYVLTGDAGLVVNEQNVINSDTSNILPITIFLLLLITGLYFRAPLTPVLVLLTIGLALLLGLAAMVALTMLTGQVTQTSLTLLLTFILGVGTDYSVFLTARYREELRLGRPHPEALATAVTWAGESIATSGTTVVLATLAMTFSGTELISDWGRVLALGVSLAILVALTLVPAFLALVGPRIFWPYTGARFRRQSEAVEASFRTRRTYFHRASRFAYERPAVVLGVVVLLSLPLVYLAVSAPLSYAYFQQLPPDQPSAEGLTTLSGNFGPGYVFPLDVLVTFDRPLLGPGNAPDLAEFAQAAYVAEAINVTSGVHRVNSLVGTGGEPLATWTSLPSLPVPQQEVLRGTLSNYLGRDGRTLEYSVELTTNGNSNAAVDTMDRIEANLSAYHPASPTISALYYGGAPSLTKDLQAQLAVSSDVMAVLIVVGLLVILFIALGSAILPPRAVVTIALSVAWAWALTYLVFVVGLNLSLFFYVPPVLFLLVMGLGMDYDIFIMTRVREERLKGKDPKTAVVDAVAHTAGIITAAAVILAGAFFALTVAQITLLRVLGFAVGAAILLDAAVIRTYLVPAILGVGGDRIWWAPSFVRHFRRSPADVPVTVTSEGAPGGAVGTLPPSDGPR